MSKLLVILTGTLAILTAGTVQPQNAHQTAHPFRLVTEKKHAKLSAAIPRTNSELMEKIRADPRLMLFTKDEMPAVFQAADNNRPVGQRLGVLRAGTTFTVGGVVVGGGSNQFPWRTPAGLGDATGWDSFQGLWLPEGGFIEYGLERLPGDRGSARSVTWTLPVNAVFLEVLGVVEGGESPDPVPFEMRARRKIESGEWRVAVFRPYRNRAELNLAVALSGSPSAERFTTANDTGSWTFANPLFAPLTRAGRKDFLPPLEPTLVRRLLDVTFVSAHGEEWIDGGFAPDVRSGFHIVPPGYGGAALNVAEETCIACHRTAGQNISRFGMPAPANWDEWVRGNGADQNFTWHPFDLDSISTDGTFKPVFVRGDLVRAGLLKERGK